jgi:hypothetical protein
MLPKKRIRTHPETILRGEFLEPLGVSQVAFAEHLGIPLQRVNVIVRGERGVRSDTSWLYAGALRARPNAGHLARFLRGGKSLRVMRRQTFSICASSRSSLRPLAIHPARSLACWGSTRVVSVLPRTFRVH